MSFLLHLFICRVGCALFYQPKSFQWKWTFDSRVTLPMSFTKTWTRITITKPWFKILFNIVLKQDLISTSTIYEKYSYAHFLSFAILVSYIVFFWSGAMLIMVWVFPKKWWSFFLSTENILAWYLKINSFYKSYSPDQGVT